MTEARNNWKCSWTRKRAKIVSLLQKGKEPIIFKAYSGLDESAAFAMEASLITHYGRLDIGTGCLCNMSDGGEGNTGHRYTTDENIYTIRDQHGNTFTGSRLDIREKIFNGNHQTAQRLFNGGISLGWFIGDEPPEKLYVRNDIDFELYSIKENKMVLVNKGNCKEHGFTIDGFLELVREKKNAKIRFWHTLPKNIDSGKKSWFSNFKKHRFYNTKENYCVEKTIPEMAKEHGGDRTLYLMCASGKIAYTGDWVMA